MALTRRARAAVELLRHRDVADRYREIFARQVAGRTCADIGCLFRVHGRYSFMLEALGAAAVTAVDVEPASAEFKSEHARLGSKVRFSQGDLMDPTLVERIGTFDVVFCAGVLYHLPDPLGGLQRLRALTRERLILGSVLIEDGLLVRQRAVFLPGLASDPGESLRARLTRIMVPGSAAKRQVAHGRLGVDSPFRAEDGYSPWFWGLSPSAVTAMLHVAGFEVERIHHRWIGAIFECRAR